MKRSEKFLNYRLIATFAYLAVAIFAAFNYSPQQIAEGEAWWVIFLIVAGAGGAQYFHGRQDEAERYERLGVEA